MGMREGRDHPTSHSLSAQDLPLPQPKTYHNIPTNQLLKINACHYSDMVSRNAAGFFSSSNKLAMIVYTGVK